MKILLVAINAKYIHSNLAVYCLKTYAEKNMPQDGRGGSGTLNLQSAIAGVILRRGRQSAGLPPESDVDVWVSRDGTL